MNTEKKLYQWDTGQKLTGCTGLYVDFPIDNEVYRVETADGMCIIPDELLQTSGGHKVYECMTNNTIRSFAFSVTPRPKPPDYVYTPTERLTFEGLVQKVDDAVADMIRRAESGEFDGHTPVKGTDYFTTAEIQQIQNEVSSGAVGDFKSVVDTETDKFNANATAKLNAYNTNANNRVAEFDSHTEQIQTDISELKSDLVNFANTFDEVINVEFSNFGKYIKAQDGTITLIENNNYVISDKYILYGKRKVVAKTVSNGIVSCVAFYDKDNNYLSSISNAQTTLAEIIIDLTNAEYKNANYVIFGCINYQSVQAQVYASIEPNNIFIPRAKKDLKIQVFGDSISDNSVGDGKTWVNHIHNLLTDYNVTVIDSAVAGSTIAYNNENSICAKVMNTEVLKDNDVVVIFGGTNDWAGGVGYGDFLGNGTNNFGNAVNEIIKYMSENKPNTRLIMVAPMQRYNSDDKNRPTNDNGEPFANQYNLKTLNDYCHMIEDTCKFYGIPCLNMYEVGGFNRINIDTWTVDGLHPNDNGDMKIAREICNFIKQHI